MEIRKVLRALAIRVFRRRLWWYVWQMDSNEILCRRLQLRYY